MSTPEGKKQGDGAPVEERRKGEDRRQGERRAGGDGERRTGISVSRTFRRQSFFDHPVWVAATILFGVALGIGLMSFKSWDATTHKPDGIDMKIVPGADSPSEKPPQ